MSIENLTLNMMEVSSEFSSFPVKRYKAKGKLFIEKMCVNRTNRQGHFLASFCPFLATCQKSRVKVKGGKCAHGLDLSNALKKLAKSCS